MSGTFDAYHVWLGIPPSEQPPNHYRLLGITAFETDLDVIDHAANRQMAHVRTFQSGKHGPRSQALLNELSSARLCLLNADKKSAYDDQLRTKMSSVPKAVPTAAQIPKAAPVAVPVAKAQPASAPRANPEPAPKPRASEPLVAADDASLIDIPLEDEPAPKPAPHAKPAAASASGLQSSPTSVAATTDEAYEPEPLLAKGFDEDDFAAAASSSNVHIRVGRRSRSQSTWKRPVALGIMAGVLVISFFFLYYLVRYLVRNSGELQNFIMHGPAASGPVEPGAEGEEAAAPPPPPAEQ